MSHVWQVALARHGGDTNGLNHQRAMLYAWSALLLQYAVHTIQQDTLQNGL